jgi:hypothetical protein
MNVSALTERIGYESEAAFSKAFQTALRHAAKRVPSPTVAGGLRNAAIRRERAPARDSSRERAVRLLRDG